MLLRTGAFGFYPLIDRKRNYYFQIVAYESSRRDYPRSGIPEYLRFLAKPLADAVIEGEAGLEFAAAHHTPRFDIYIYIYIYWGDLGGGEHITVAHFQRRQARLWCRRTLLSYRGRTSNAAGARFTDDSAGGIVGAWIEP